MQCIAQFDSCHTFHTMSYFHAPWCTAINFEQFPWMIFIACDPDFRNSKPCKGKQVYHQNKSYLILLQNLDLNGRILLVPWAFLKLTLRSLKKRVGELSRNAITCCCFGNRDVDHRPLIRLWRQGYATALFCVGTWLKSIVMNVLCLKNMTCR